LRRAATLIDGTEWRRAMAAFLPADESGIMPLFAAIAHGCSAEREDEAFREVYLPRIARGNEDFATTKLGLYGQDLAVLASFFKTPFTAPLPRLEADLRTLMLNHAGYDLLALGRLEDAVMPLRARVKGRHGCKR
jgi:hypothetical protein